jgi:lipopolysaccharide/colanic/teichoic acid biosynthesis glycosyltransferase
MDIAISALLLILLIPVFIIIAISIKISSRGSVLFIQDRIGLNKRVFRLYKFRTMVENAEQKQDLLESLNEMSGPAFKIKNDPRIHKIGRFLRKTSLDELPQLFNVLKGDMSLVGPRPLPVRDYNGFEIDWHRRRFSVLPGLTCLWQVNGRNNIPFDKWMELDLEYIDKWTLMLDFRILMKTIPTILRGSGAS